MIRNLSRRSMVRRGGRRAVIAVAGAAVALTLSSRSLGSLTTVNEWCPVLPEERADPQVTTVYQGKTVAFCCDRCRAKFLSNPDRYIGRLPQFAEPAAAAPSGQESHEHEGHDERPHGLTDDEPRAAEPATTGRHQHGEGSEPEGDAKVPLLGRLHPLIIHFPLAGIPLALLGLLTWVVTGREAFARADVPPLVVAGLAAIGAVITGNIAHDAMAFSETLHRIVEQHEFISTVVMILTVCLCGLRIWRWNGLTGRWRLAYGAGLVAAVLLVGTTGYLGGSLVFGPDHLKW